MWGVVAKSITSESNFSYLVGICCYTPPSTVYDMSPHSSQLNIS